MNAEEKIIEVKNLTIGYKNFILLDKLDFDIKRGEVFGILGGSGCGKSSILKHMIGLYSPIKGDILIEGESIVKADEAGKEKIMFNFGVLYQSGALFSSLTLEENVSFPLKEFTSLPDDLISSIARMKLELVGLGKFCDFYPSEISGGMKKRAGLARAMALDPDILFFDEPSAGLDPISSAELDRLILELRDTLGSTMVIVTHELDSIFTVTDRVIILDKIKKGIIAEGNAKDLRKDSPEKWVTEFLNRSSLRG